MTAAAPRKRVTRMPSIDIVRELPLWDEQPDVDSTLQRDGRGSLHRHVNKGCRTRYRPDR